MLDSLFKPAITPQLSNAATKLSENGLNADRTTIIAYALGLFSCLAIGFQSYLLAVILLIASRGIDAVAKHMGGATGIGSKLRPTLNVLLMSAFVFFFAIGQDHQALAAAFLILTYAVLFSFAVANAPTSDGAFHPANIVENSELAIFMVLICLTPGAFSAYTAIFVIMCWVTIAGRVWTVVKPPKTPPLA